jgi:DNA-binding Lrp family transcriptional regulator
MQGQADRKIDNVDLGIMAALRKDPQSTNKQIAEHLRVSEMTIANRIGSLIADGVMKITVQRDIRTLGYELVGIVDVFVDADRIEPVGEQLGGIEEALSVTIFADSPQVKVLVMARDLSHFLSIVEDRIGVIAGVNAVDTSIFLDMFSIKAGIAAL